MQVAFIVPLCIPVVLAASLHKSGWFYPGLMIVVGTTTCHLSSSTACDATRSSPRPSYRAGMVFGLSFADRLLRGRLVRGSGAPALRCPPVVHVDERDRRAQPERACSMSSSPVRRNAPQQEPMRPARLIGGKCVIVECHRPAWSFARGVLPAGLWPLDAVLAPRRRNRATTLAGSSGQCRWRRFAPSWAALILVAEAPRLRRRHRPAVAIVSTTIASGTRSGIYPLSS